MAPSRLLALSPIAQVMLFRVIQEALQNSIKHADALSISISIAQLSDHVKINIVDDGKGMPEQFEKKKGLGLSNMQHRALTLGGSIKWVSAPGKGTSINIIVPLPMSNE